MKIERFSEKDYTEIINEVGSFRYSIFDQGESLPGNVLPKALPVHSYTPVLVGTGSTTSIYTFSEAQGHFIVPKGSCVIVQRLLRFDDTHGTPHFNADDFVIFPTQEGNIFRMKKDKAEDHFIKITNSAHLNSIAAAYHLPQEKSGPVEEYKKNGASLPIKIIGKE